MLPTLENCTFTNTFKGTINLKPLHLGQQLELNATVSKLNIEGSVMNKYLIYYVEISVKNKTLTSPLQLGEKKQTLIWRKRCSKTGKT